MFDSLNKKYKSLILNLNFGNKFVNHLENRKITATTISKKHSVSKLESKEIIIKNKLIVSESEEKYKQNKLKFFDEKFISYYNPPEINQDKISNGLRDGYAYFYKFFLKKQNIDVHKINESINCPICEKEIDLDLDHIIPKSKYPIFSLMPINLVPICSDCNRKGKSDKFDFEKNLPFHPLFEEINLKNKIIINLNQERMNEELGEGLEVRYTDDRIKNLVNLYNLNELIIKRIKTEIRIFIEDLIKADNYIYVKNQYDPTNIRGYVGDIKMITDNFIFNLGEKELKFLTTDVSKKYFEIL